MSSARRKTCVVAPHGMSVPNRVRRARRKRSLAPETFCARDLADLCVRRDYEGLRRYLLRFEGACVSLGWPSQCFYVVGGSHSPYLLTEIDLEHCQNDFFGEFRDMHLIGVVSYAACRYPVFVDAHGAVFAYDAQEDCLYELASDLGGFFAKGMIRCDPVHESICARLQPGVSLVHPDHKAELCRRSRVSARGRYLRSLLCFRELLACGDDPQARSAYVESHRDAQLILTWPERHHLLVRNAQDLGLTASALRRFQRSLYTREPLTALGEIEGPEGKTFFNHVKILCGDTGAVYAALVGHDKLVKLARDLKAFVRVGLALLIDDFRYENIGPIDHTSLHEVNPELKLPFKKRRLIVGYFEPLSSLYLRGQPKFSSLWRGLRDAWIHKRQKLRERLGGVQLQRYVRATAGRWIPLCWPPLHGLLLGDSNYFGVVRDQKIYRRFSCLRQAGRLYFIGLISVYECVPDARVAPEIWVSSQGHAFAYLPGEDKVYVLGLSFSEFYENGLFAVYSFFERDYVDEVVESTWFKHTFAGMYELSQLLHDRAGLLRVCQLNAGCKIRLGGSPACTFTFGSWNVAEADEANGFVIGVLEKARYAVIGWLEPVQKAIFMDPLGGIHVLLYGTALVKLAESLRGFIRQGSFWFRCPRRFCFSPLGSPAATYAGGGGHGGSTGGAGAKPIGLQTLPVCDVSEYVFSDRRMLEGAGLSP
ncbi:protein UL29 [Panine betaherpesvirus 2]|uniref:Protein UL29 n=1 Tax=Panine betaherpesvirus 2 TaxID=188763 RepID=Q8QS59_9BETA|nr:protein UL29 [Panine betaherpesvirus 2]AAM00680.2 protein UL29 [Panine betaherpesvirus 2]QXV67782.1 protein UL29 [Panine betaherpesvirus 2]